MSAAQSRLQCRWCGLERTVKQLRQSHGRWAVVCANQQTVNWLNANGYAAPGRDAVVLDRAGLLVHRPLRVQYTKYERVVDPGTDQVSWQFDGVARLLSFESFAPAWAVRLARRLMDDQELISSLGGYKLQEVAANRKNAGLGLVLGSRLYGGKPGILYKKVLPVEVRVKLLCTAAASPMAREMFEDDALAAALIARDS